MHPQPKASHRAATHLALIVAILSFAACAGPRTTIEQAWMGSGSHAFTSVAVLYNSEDGAIRRIAEDRLVRQLRAQGVRAEPAYAILTKDEAADLDRAKATLRDAGFDGLISMRVIEKEQHVEYVPSYGGYWGGYWGPYYGGGGGYAYVATDVRVETTAYSLADDKLVYSAISHSDDVDSTKQVVSDVTKLVAGDLGKRGVVATRERPSTTATARR